MQHLDGPTYLWTTQHLAGTLNKVMESDEKREEDREPFWWDDNGAEMTFVENMRMLRARRGLSQTEFAKRAQEQGLSFHQPTVQRIERGERPVKLTEAIVIANILGSDLQSMMNDVSLPFAYSALVDSTSWSDMEARFDYFNRYNRFDYVMRQIQEHRDDYLKAAEHFKAEPVPEVMERVEFVLGLLAEVEAVIEEATKAVNEKAEILKSLPPLPPKAHGGTPWDGDVDE